MISDSDLLILNKKGFIPGPGETEDAFLKRVAFLKQASSEQILSFEEPIHQEVWKEAHRLTEDLFDVSTDWVPAFFSNRQLPFWQGAAAWICETEEGVKLPVLQLKTSFKKQKHFGLYRIDEVLAHEALHATRMQFDQPKFEELLAYRTSQSRFRRWFGPLFRTSKESYLFVFLLLVPLSIQVIRLFMEDNLLLQVLFFLPWIAIGWGLLRLYRTQLIFSRCEKKIRPCLKNPTQAPAVLFRLTDDEIISFSKMPSEDIHEYIRKQRNNSFRWKLLALAYFSN